MRCTDIWTSPRNICLISMLTLAFWPLFSFIQLFSSPRSWNSLPSAPVTFCPNACYHSCNSVTQLACTDLCKLINSALAYRQDGGSKSGCKVMLGPDSLDIVAWGLHCMVWLKQPLYIIVLYSMAQIIVGTIGKEGARGSAVGWGTALQVGRSRVRFPMLSLEFFIDVILPAALWSWGRLSL